MWHLNIYDPVTWMVAGFLLYVIAYMVVRATRRAMMNERYYDWRSVIINFIFAIGGPLTILICLLVFLFNDDFEFETKPPKWL